MSQVRPVSLPDALSITLDNYYDLLKSQVGGLGADEFLQLKLVADPVDIDDERYRFFSLYQLLNRSDLAIDPKPVSGTIMTSAEQLNRVYGRFIQRLRSYVVRRELDEEDQEKIADLDMKMDRNPRLLPRSGCFRMSKNPGRTMRDGIIIRLIQPNRLVVP